MREPTDLSEWLKENETEETKKFEQELDREYRSLDCIGCKNYQNALSDGGCEFYRCFGEYDCYKPKRDGE